MRLWITRAINPTLTPPEEGGGEEIGAGCPDPTVTLGTADSTTVQSAINAAANGDCIRLPAGGSATWAASSVVMPSTKGLTLDGNGSTITRSGANFTAPLVMNTNTTTASRITNFIFAHGSSGSNNNERFLVINTHDDPDVSDPYFRVDHCTFNGDDVIGTPVVIAGTGYGLMDHCTWNLNGNQEVIQHTAYQPGNDDGWLNDLTPGSYDAFYVEDCLFNNAAAPLYLGGKTFATYGARVVYRFNECRRFALDVHGNVDPTGRWQECYNNAHTLNNGDNVSDWYITRGGSGLIFDNVANGSNNGGGQINFYEDSDDGNTGPWPQNYQVGMGKMTAGVHERQPLYCFRNTGTDGFVYSFPTDEDLVVQLDRDVITDTSNNGVRQGTLAQMNALVGMTQYMAFWATDSGAARSDGITNGELYRYNGSAWVLYYRPAEYPHPLRFVEF